MARQRPGSILSARRRPPGSNRRMESRPSGRDDLDATGISEGEHESGTAAAAAERGPARLAVGPFAKPPRLLAPGAAASREIDSAESMISNCTFSPDGSWLAASGHDGVKLWKTAARSAPRKPEFLDSATAL